MLSNSNVCGVIVSLAFGGLKDASIVCDELLNGRSSHSEEEATIMMFVLANVSNGHFKAMKISFLLPSFNSF